MGNIETANLDMNRPRRKIFDNRLRKSYSPASNLDLSSNRIYLKNFKNVRYPSPISTPLTERTQKKISKPFLNKSTILTSKSVRANENTPQKFIKAYKHQKQCRSIQQQKLLAEIQSDRIHNILCPTEFAKNTSYQQKIAEKQNRERCKDIIKKVRNFNDFLNQVKKRIKYQSEKCDSDFQRQPIEFQQKTTYKSDFHNRSEQQKTIQHYKQINTKKSLNLALKLENQRIELQKYKKLLVRELSKQNIVQNITVQNSNHDQKHKILTIKYESKKFSQKSTHPVKQKYNQVVKKVDELGKQLNNLNDQFQSDSYKSPSTIQQQTKKISQIYSKQKISTQRINKIENLFQKVQEIQQRHYKNCNSIAKCLDEKKQRQSSNDQELF